MTMKADWLDTSPQDSLISQRTCLLPLSKLTSAVACPFSNHWEMTQEDMKDYKGKIPILKCFR